MMTRICLVRTGGVPHHDSPGPPLDGDVTVQLVDPGAVLQQQELDTRPPHGLVDLVLDDVVLLVLLQKVVVEVEISPLQHEAEEDGEDGLLLIDIDQIKDRHAGKHVCSREFESVVHHNLLGRGFVTVVVGRYQDHLIIRLY